MESSRWLAQCVPDFFGLYRLRGVEREPAADVASVCMRVPDDDVPRRVLRLLLSGKEPLPGAAALGAVPVAVLQRQVVALVQERE